MRRLSGHGPGVEVQCGLLRAHLLHTPWEIGEQLDGFPKLGALLKD